MKVITNLYNQIKNDGLTLRDIMLQQHIYHESRRWSINEILEKYKDNPAAKVFSKNDKAALWHTVQGEATTQPGGLTIATSAHELAEKYANINPNAEIIFKSLESWLARHWLNEEGHHEVAFSILGDLANVERMTDKQIIEHRQYFPADKIGRKLILQACVETEVSISYANMVKTTKNPLVKEVFQNVMKDEVQHRLYFISFAKALVEMGVVPIKDILSMTYSWIRPGGDTYSTQRENISERDDYVNWWETVDHDQEYALDDTQYKNESIQHQKNVSIFSIIKFTTGIEVNSIEELQKAYMSSLRKPTPITC